MEIKYEVLTVCRPITSWSNNPLQPCDTVERITYCLYIPEYDSSVYRMSADNGMWIYGITRINKEHSTEIFRFERRIKNIPYGSPVIMCWDNFEDINMDDDEFDIGLGHVRWYPNYRLTFKKFLAKYKYNPERHEAGNPHPAVHDIDVKLVPKNAVHWFEFKFRVDDLSDNDVKNIVANMHDNLRDCDDYANPKDPIVLLNSDAFNAMTYNGKQTMFCVNVNQLKSKNMFGECVMDMFRSFIEYIIAKSIHNKSESGKDNENE